jgi:hypothetical protein
MSEVGDNPSEYHGKILGKDMWHLQSSEELDNQTRKLTFHHALSPRLVCVVHESDKTLSSVAVSFTSGTGTRKDVLFAVISDVADGQFVCGLSSEINEGESNSSNYEEMVLFGITTVDEVADALDHCLNGNVRYSNDTNRHSYRFAKQCILNELMVLIKVVNQ